jgi:hypothetical protein
MPFSSSIPSIAQAYQNDPRNRLSQSMLAAGTSTAPVAWGGWGVADGLARAAQAVAGAYTQRRTDKKYEEREAAYTDALRNAAQSATAPQPVFNPAQINPATINNSTPAQQPSPQMAPQPTAPPTQQGPAPAPQQPEQQQLSARDYYYNGIVPIEGGTDRNGNFRTSPKGAIGPGQVMPGTAPEAARLAGVPFDDNLYRTNADYNNRLGEAYYNAQLQQFGDPIMAAAAYNAGPGRVQRAVRQANSKGGSWSDYLPTETKNYIQNFASRVGGEQSGTPIPRTQVAAPTMEQVPNAPEIPNQAPQAPNLPGEVRSNRLDVALAMLNSGNPDLAMLAQDYLDKGLGEQFDARTLTSGQAFERDSTTYQAALNDFYGARDQGRQNQYNERASVQERNFGRETNYNNQTFQAGENAANRSFQGQQASLDRTATRQNLERTIEGRLQTEREKRDARRSNYFNTAAGQKELGTLQTRMAENDNAIQQYQRFIDANERAGTGGIRAYTGGIESAWDDDIGLMRQIANDTTLAKLGGSLGAQISNSDRDYIAASNVSLGNTPEVNRNIAETRIKALQRSSDYAENRANAMADGDIANFTRQWNQFANEQSIRLPGEYVTFQEWLDYKSRGGR